MRRKKDKGCLCVAFLLCVTALPAMAQRAVDETISAFLEHVGKSTTFDAKARRFVTDAWDERRADDDPEEFLLEALAVLSEEFAAGLDAFDDEDYGRAFRSMADLSVHQDPYIGANASVFAIKSLVEQDRLEEAAERIDAFLLDPTAVDLYTPYAAEIAFLQGYVTLQNLDYDAAAGALQKMLDEHADASERLRVSARQMLAELRSREPERLGDVADLMLYAGRRLGHEHTDEGVQGKQQRAIDLLDKLIEEAEKNEQGGGGGGGGGSSGGQNSPQSPMQESQLPGGGGRVENLRNTRRVRPGEAWGAMPPAEREKILQSLRDSFPSRYRRLVEQYYQDLSKQP